MLFFTLKHHYNRFYDDQEKDFEYPQYDWQKKDWWRWIAPFILRIIDRKNYLKSVQ